MEKVALVGEELQHDLFLKMHIFENDAKQYSLF